LEPPNRAVVEGDDIHPVETGRNRLLLEQSKGRHHPGIINGAVLDKLSGQGKIVKVVSALSADKGLLAAAAFPFRERPRAHRRRHGLSQEYRGDERCHFHLTTFSRRFFFNSYCPIGPYSSLCG
jgi:hypothetical protein